MSFWRGESRFHSTVSTPASTVPPQSRSGKLTPASATQRGVFGASSCSSSAGTKWPMNISLSSLLLEILEVLVAGRLHGHLIRVFPLRLSWIYSRTARCRLQQLEVGHGDARDAGRRPP